MSSPAEGKVGLNAGSEELDPGSVCSQSGSHPGKRFQALWRAQAPAGMGIFLCWKHPELLFLPMVLFSEKKRCVGGGLACTVSGTRKGFGGEESGNKRGAQGTAGHR